MVSNVLYSIPSRWIRVQDFRDQVFAVVAQKLRKREVGLQDFLIELLGILVFKGEISTDHGEKNDAAAPQISPETKVSFTFDHLRRSITRTSTGCF